MMNLYQFIPRSVCGIVCIRAEEPAPPKEEAPCAENVSAAYPEVEPVCPAAGTAGVADLDGIVDDAEGAPTVAAALF